ncbi:MAG: class I adenylate-forming enzyme family protein [Phycisphaeraceae bacterium]
MSSQLIQQVLRHATERADDAAILWCDSAGHAQTVTWSQLLRGAAAVAEQLRQRTSADAVVLVSIANRPELTVSFLAGLLADRAVFMVPPNLTAAELRQSLARSGARSAIGSSAALTAITADLDFHLPLNAVPTQAARDDQRLQKLVQQHAGCGALLLQSSGTTGRPKIVRREMSALDAVGEHCRVAVGIEANDRMLAAVPLCHSFGMDHGLMAAMLAGCAVEMQHGFTLAAISDGIERGATILPGVPFMFEMLAGTTALPQHRLRRVYSAGGPLPPEVADRFAKAWGVRIGQVYGSTEFGSVTFNDPDVADYDATAVGHPIGDVQLRVLDVEQADVHGPLSAGEEGQVAVKGASMLSGYVDATEPPTVEGWFLSGDLGRLDDQGRLTLTGRLKLLIDVGGLKVNPIEIEAVLTQHPAVQDAIVVPMPMSQTVQRIKAIVTLRPSTERTEADVLDELRRFARQQLSRWKVPRVIEVRNALPKSPTGKILRQAVQC